MSTATGEACAPSMERPVPSGKIHKIKRVDGELVSILHDELAKQFVDNLEDWVTNQVVSRGGRKGKPRSFTPCDRAIAKLLVTLPRDTGMADWESMAPALAPLARCSTRTVERFFQKTWNCPWLSFQQGNRSPVAAKRCRARVRLMEDTAEALLYSGVAEKVSAAKSIRTESYLKVTGHLPPVATRATRCRRRGESKPSADSRNRDRQPQSGSAVPPAGHSDDRSDSARPGSTCSTSSSGQKPRDHGHGTNKQTRARAGAACDAMPPQYQPIFSELIATLQAVVPEETLAPANVQKLLQKTMVPPADVVPLVMAALTFTPESTLSKIAHALAALRPGWVAAKAQEVLDRQRQEKASTEADPVDAEPSIVDEAVADLVGFTGANEGGARSAVEGFLAVHDPMTFVFLLKAIDEKFKRKPQGIRDLPAFAVSQLACFPRDTGTLDLVHHYQRLNAVRSHPADWDSVHGRTPGAGWSAVKLPLRADAQARALFEAWQRLLAVSPAPDSPAYLGHYDAERKAFGDLVARAEERMGDRAEPLREALRLHLVESNLLEGTLVWRRVWKHHWYRIVCEHWNLP